MSKLGVSISLVTMLSFNSDLTFFLFSSATGAGSPQQREPVTVSPYHLSHPVNFPCGRKPEYSEKTLDFPQSVDYNLHMRTGFKSTLLGIELGTLEVKGEWSDHHYYTTEAPQHCYIMTVSVLLEQPCNNSDSPIKLATILLTACFKLVSTSLQVCYSI